MLITLTHQHTTYTADLARPIDCSIPVGQVKCFHSTDYKVTPYQSGDFVGSVSKGAPVNFYNVQLNPHGNGTHTECLGHITHAQESINDKLKQFHFIAGVLSINVTLLEDGDRVLERKDIEESYTQLGYDLSRPEALMIRTLPNGTDKLSIDYSDTNPPYLSSDAMTFLVEMGVNHLLLDLPSVDREYDDGQLACHHLFWNVAGHDASEESRDQNTITEMIYIPDNVSDGLYLLNLQIPSLPLDAAPSKPVIYQLTTQSDYDTK